MRTTTQHRSSSFRLFSSLAAAIVFSGCAQTDAPVAPPAAQPATLAVKLCDSSSPGCSGSGSFSIGTMRDLSLDVEWQNVPAGTHTQQITLVQPNGVVYQTVSHGFSVPDGTLGSPAVNDLIPVAGTFITQRSLTGQWSVEISLDGKTIGVQSFQFAP
ncbi:MAG TPA: hypothetical protein VKD70_08260 [Candidatus Acidoferrum sp.]|nr:hypothetical protein [Candidatus Acidoferrum sp.]